MHLKSTIVVVCFLCSLTAHGQGANDTLPGQRKTSLPLQQEMQEVVITGQYAPHAKENAVQKIDVIDRKTIDAMAAQNLRDALNNQLDIRLSYDPIFGTSLNMQGSKGYGADAKILIDGVPVVGKQNGAVDLSQINLANIERIEIVKGPMSVSYGTDAIAGTVNLITKKTIRHSWETSVSTYYESIGTYNANFRAGFHKGKHTISVDGMRNFFGGWNPTDGPSFFDFKAQLADTNRAQLWKPREQYAGTVQYGYTFGKLTVNYKGSYFNEIITARGTPLPPYREMAFDNYFHTYRVDNAVFVNGAVATNKNISFLAAYNAYKRIKNVGARDLTTLDEVLTPGDQDTSKYDELNSRATFSTSDPQARVNYEVGYDINIQYANSTQITGRIKDMGNYAVFLSGEYKPTSQLTIRPGVRVAYNALYPAPLVPSINMMYKPGSDWTFRASYAKGFRQPGLKELYFDFVDINHNIHGNEHLRAELSDNYNASGVYSRLHNAILYKVNASIYYNNVRDLISLASVAGGTANEYSYVNVGQYKTKGVQMSLDMTGNSWSGAVGASLIGTYNSESETSNVPGFSYSPEIRGNIMYTIRKPGISISVFYKYTGRFVAYMVDQDGNPYQTFMAGYNAADITIGRSFFGKRLNMSAGCKNLFDVTNVSANAAGGAHSSAINTTAVGTGRYYFLKTELNLYK